MDTPKPFDYIKFVPKIWGWEKWLINEIYCAKELHIRKYHATSWHYHNVKDEIFYVLNGHLKVNLSWEDSEVESEVVILKPAECLHLPVGIRHRLIAYNGVVTLLECSTHHEDSDSIRILEGY